MTVAERRQALLEWFYADEERNGLGTRAITTQASWSTEATDITTGVRSFGRWWLYSTKRRARDRCLRDLKALERNGDITRGQTGGKATWWYA